MRFILTYLFVIVPLLGFSQSLKDIRISIVIEDQTLEQALIQIGEVAQVNISYNSKLIQFDKKVTYTAENTSIEEILDKIINDPTIDYLFINPQVILKKASPEQQEIRIQKSQIEEQKIKEVEKKAKKERVEKRKEAENKRAEKIKEELAKKKAELAAADSSNLSKLEQKPDSIASMSLADSTLNHDSLKVKKWNFDIVYSPLFIKDTYTSNDGLKSTINLINQNEKAILSHAISFRFGRGFNKVKVETGLTYSSTYKQGDYNLTIPLTDTVESYDITDKGVYSDPFVKNSGYYILSLKDTTWFTNYDSTWIPKLDTTVVADYQTTDTVINNNDKIRVDHIMIPLLISYRFGQIGKNKWAVAPKLGVIAAFTISRSGRTLNTEGNAFVQTNEIPFTKVLLIGYSGLNISYGLSDNTAIFAEVFYSQSINNVYKPEYGLSRSISSFGSTIGLRYNF